MEVRITDSELTALVKELRQRPALILEMLGMKVQNDASQQMVRDDIALRGISVRSIQVRGIGDVVVKVLPDPDGDLRAHVSTTYERHKGGVQEDVLVSYLKEMSARSLSLLSRRLTGRSISRGKVGEAYDELTEAIEQWRHRDLSRKRIKYLYAGSIVLKKKSGGSGEKPTVLVAIGVTENNARQVIGLKGGTKDGLTDWRGFFKDLKDRGLDGSLVRLGVMDGCGGLAEAFLKEFPGVKIQWCQARVTRDVLTEVSGALKKEAADDLRPIFYASSRERVGVCYSKFKQKWERLNPAAVKVLSRAMDGCMTFFAFPREEWVSLRTANVVERLSREFRRIRRLIESTADEKVLCQLLAFVALRMQLSWRANPLGKVRSNLPLYRAHT